MGNRQYPLHPCHLIGVDAAARARSTRRFTATATSSGNGIACTQTRHAQDTDRHQEPLLVHLPYLLESLGSPTSCTKPAPPTAAQNVFAKKQ
jgi:hypothetical protein